MTERGVRTGRAIAAAAGWLLVVGAAFADPEPYDLEQAYVRWEQAVAGKSGTLSAPRLAATATPILIRPKAGEVIIDGRLIRTREIQPAAPVQTSNETEFAAPADVPEGSASAVLAGATPVVEAAPTLSPTPALVTIRVPQIEGNSIKMVEIQVTPTPAPTAVGGATAPMVIPAASRVLSVSDAARVIPATGTLGDLRNRLSAAMFAEDQEVKLSAKEIAKLREQIMSQAARNKSALEGIVAATELTQLQVMIHRLAAKPADATLDPKTARTAFKVLFPEGVAKLDRLREERAEAFKKLADQLEADRAAQAAASDSAGAEGDDAMFFTGQPEAAVQERKIFIDPVTGQYIYEDGSPVPGYAPVQPQAPAYQPPAPQPQPQPYAPQYQRPPGYSYPPPVQQPYVPPPQPYAPQYSYPQQPQGVLGGDAYAPQQYYDESQLDQQPYYVDDGNEYWQGQEYQFEEPQHFDDGQYQEYEFDEGMFEEQNFDFDEGAFEGGDFYYDGDY